MRTVKNVLVLISLTYSLIMAALGWFGFMNDLGRWLVDRKKTA